MTTAAGLVWADEMRLGLRGLVRRVWAPRGVKVRQAQVLTYVWRYLALAVNGLAGTLRWAWTTSMKKEAIATVVAEWQRAGLEAVVWDGAASHRARLVRDIGLRLDAAFSTQFSVQRTHRVPLGAPEEPWLTTRGVVLYGAITTGIEW